MIRNSFALFSTTKLYFWFVLLCSVIKESFHYVEELKENQLIQNKALTILPVMESTYTVFFKLKQNSFLSREYGNIIHFTIGNNIGRYGDRNPAVFSFNDGSGRIAISISLYETAVSGENANTEPLPLNEWSSIQISQFQNDKIFIYAIYINGRILYSAVNNLPMSFQNVTVYISNPWYPATDASIKDLRIINGNQDFVNDLNEHLLIKDNLIATLPLMESSYSVSFKFKPLSDSFWWNVIHLTNGNNYGAYGDRILSIWFMDRILFFWSDINGVKCTSTLFDSQPLPLNEWSSIRVSQFQNGNKSTFAVYLNGKNVYSTENKMPSSFNNVNVYVANPWHTAANGIIKDVRVINGNEEMRGVFLTAKYNKTQNEEIYIHLNVTSDCLCYLLNVYIYLQQEWLLTFKRFMWGDLSLNGSVHKDSRGFFVIAVGNLDVYLYRTFTVIFGYGKNIPNTKKNVSVIIHSSWNNCYGDSIPKANQQPIIINIERSVTSVNKMNPTGVYKQENGTLIETQTYQFNCTPLQKRQPSLCYRRERSSGIITFLPIHIMNVIGYDQTTSLIYGSNFRNSIFEVDLNKKKPIVISSEKCSKIKACNPSLGVK